MQELKTCTGCKKPHDTKFLRCQQCRDATKRQGDKRTERLLSQGKCRLCGKNAITTDTKYCVLCLEKKKSYAYKNKDKIKLSVKKQYDQRRSNGQCVGCGIPSPDYVHCEQCRMAMTERVRSVKSRRLSENICVDCGKDPNHPTATKCLQCSLRRRSRKLKMPLQPLIDLWNSQTGICPISGIHLDQTNADLDHIVPKSKGGTNDIENLRFVHSIYNAAKLDKDDSEVLDFIFKCYHHLNS